MALHLPRHCTLRSLPSTSILLSTLSQIGGPYVEQGIKNISTKHFFGSQSSVGKWFQALKDTQLFLTKTKKKVNQIRSKRRRNKHKQLQDLEAQIDQGAVEKVEKYLKIKATLRQEEEINCEHLKLFLSDWWIGKGDRPSKEMFSIIKKKQKKDFIPMPKREDGSISLSE